MTIVMMQVNHEMGHIQYYLQYKNLSYFYRTGANPGGLSIIVTVISSNKVKCAVVCWT